MLNNQKFQSKADQDDLFAEDSPKVAKKENNEDDFFADDSPVNNKNKSDDEDDFFDDKEESKVKQERKDSNPFEAHDDDPFSSSIDPRDKAQEKKKPKPTEDVEVGDLFTTQLKIKLPEVSKPQSKFRYFGEVRDADSLYQIKHDNRLKMRDILESQRKCTMIVEKSSKETVKIQERILPEEVRNKNLTELKIFDKLSMYKFRNKRLDVPITLTLLTANKYSKVNSQNRVEKIALTLDTAQKRKLLSINYEENMDKTYDTDIKEIMSVIDSKRKKEYEDKHGVEMPEDEKMTDVSRQLPQGKETGEDIDDISSIDSDTKEEEKKFRVHDTVISGAQNVMSANISDLLQHAK